MKILKLTIAILLFILLFIVLMSVNIAVFEHLEYNLENEQVLVVILLNIFLSGLISQKIL